jgi:hypothetical protein
MQRRGPFRLQTVLLGLRPSVGTGRGSGVSQEATGVVLGEPGFVLGERGRRDSLLARRGESLFSQMSRGSEVEYLLGPCS